jgi:hypothetical protein
MFQLDQDAVTGGTHILENVPYLRAQNIGGHNNLTHSDEVLRDSSEIRHGIIFDLSKFEGSVKVFRLELELPIGGGRDRTESVGMEQHPRENHEHQHEDDCHDIAYPPFSG